MSIVDGHYRHGLRRMSGRRTDETHRTATPLELLFDLTFVAAFGVAGEQLAHGFTTGHGTAATVSFVLAMFGIVWSWINVCWFASAFDTDDWLYRVLTMLQMAGVIVLAVGLPPLFASVEHGEGLELRGIVVGYVLMRVALLAQWMRAARTDPRYWPLARTYFLFVGVAQLGWVVVALPPLGAIGGVALVTVLLALEVLGPVVAERAGARHTGLTPWHPHHLAERFSLLAIIALGETVFGTLASATEISAHRGWTLDAVMVVGSGVALSFALWWVYFLVPHGPVLEVRRGKVLLWSYGHIVLFAATAAIGAGLHLIAYTYDPDSTLLPITVVAGIAIPVAIFMVVRLLLHTWLVGALPGTVGLQLGAVVLPVVAVALAAIGAPVWACLLVVVASPLVVVVSFELGGWRSLDAQLGRVLEPAGEGAA